jgi:hypothetical protein
MTDCIEWQGTRNKRGYGRCYVDGRHWLAHRWAWTLANGPIPQGLQICHRCDNPPCCNIEHLFLGTQAENMADCAQKGRTDRDGKPFGSRCGNSSLSEADVHEIRTAYQCGIGSRRLARLFGVTAENIQAIFLGKTWVSRF